LSISPVGICQTSTSTCQITNATIYDTAVPTVYRPQLCYWTGLAVCAPSWPLQWTTDAGYPDAKFLRLVSSPVCTDLMYPWHQMYVAARTINRARSLHFSTRTVNRPTVTSPRNGGRCENWKE
jgi:hypothetical protein